MKKSLLDIQVNGFAGVDFQQPSLSAAELRRAVDVLAAHQTRFFATLITDAVAALGAKLENLERLRAADPVVANRSAAITSRGRGFRRNPASVARTTQSTWGRRSPAPFDRLQAAANGNIRLVTLAPGGRAARVHSPRHGRRRAGFARPHRRIRRGHRRRRRCGRAVLHASRHSVPIQMHRHANVMQRLLARDELTAFFIPDGIHLPPSVLRNFYRAKPAGKALFTTDCAAPAGAPPGRYRMGQVEMEVGDDRVVRLPGTQHFAGSALCPDEGVRNLQRWLGLDLQAARDHFSTLIAARFGIELPELAT
jgi:N-acetylglucosamine-6-phosphate deacetylase